MFYMLEDNIKCSICVTLAAPGLSQEDECGNQSPSPSHQFNAITGKMDNWLYGLKDGTRKITGLESWAHEY